MKKVIENAVLTATKAAYPVAVLTTQATFLSDAELMAKIAADCKKAVADYFRYAPACLDDVTANITDKFFDNLAWDYVNNKRALREFMRRSPAWNEDLQAWVINGNRTHEPDKNFILKTAWEILTPAITSENKTKVNNALRWFTEGKDFAESLLELAPKANLRQKKSKVFSALCKALGVWQDGGEFQIKFSTLCNEFNARKIDFKLIVSVNPAHFLTMSNPHGKDGKLTNGKKETMVSCHSLDSSGCYRNGAIGYARDTVSMIAFTVKDFNDKESLNYRKTSRQLFMYEVGNGVLLQSRLYDSEISGESYGGVDSKADDIPRYKLYRELIEREIAEGEQVPNFWGKADDYNDGDNIYQLRIYKSAGFGGYPDWLHFPHLTKITVLKSFKDTAKCFTVGHFGLCLECGEETTDSSRLLCESCNDGECCDDCGCRCDADELNEVINADGERIYVCDDCLQSYHYCEECGCYHHASRGQWIEDWLGNIVEFVCYDCLKKSEKYIQCEDCGEWVQAENVYWVGDDYNGYYVCESCRDNYSYCEHCEELHENGEMHAVRNADGEIIDVCDSCFDEYYEECEECGEVWHKDAIENGLCPDCAAENADKKSA